MVIKIFEGGINMSDKDKWKTFPCKSCLLKGNCKERCFNWPLNSFSLIQTYREEGIVDNNSLYNHVKENNLQHICLRCGNKDNIHGYIQMYCNECMISHVIE